jgi:UDP-glucose 4-epimerase
MPPPRRTAIWPKGMIRKPTSFRSPSTPRPAAPPLRIFGSDYPTADGTCERDYIHVSDLAQAHVDALGYLAQHDEPLIVNLGTGRAHSVREIISAIERVTGRTVPTVAAA